MNADLLETFLHESESTTLDFKVEQYPFSKATDIEKSELIKDLLAFVNAWRRTDAYILIGVREKGLGRHEVVGLNDTDHLPDHSLQQFVSSLTNAPVEFSYRSFEHQGKSIGVIRIPVQRRPRFLRKNYGRLEREVVYIRRGSSTERARPDEISQMGIQPEDASAPSPSLCVHWAHHEQSLVLGTDLQFDVVDLVLPRTEEIPDYEVGFAGLLNRDYYREFAEFWRAAAITETMRVAVKNNGDAVANAIRVVLTVPDPNEQIVVYDRYSEPDPPRSGSLVLPLVPKEPTQFFADREASAWSLTADFDKCRPKEEVFSWGYISIGTKTTTTVKLGVKTYCDELPSPVEQELEIRFSVKSRVVTVNELIERAP